MRDQTFYNSRGLINTDISQEYPLSQSTMSGMYSMPRSSNDFNKHRQVNSRSNISRNLDKDSFEDTLAMIKSKKEFIECKKADFDAMKGQFDEIFSNYEGISKAPTK